VVRAFEDLPLFRDGADDCLQRGALVDVAEDAGVDLGDHGGDAPANGPEVLQALLPEKPRLVSAAGIVAPTAQ